ncbi:hypothetical protein [Paraburkholderia mimosarum]|uniref:hypothetical protein n=1 Tax=Paraburkholderia mimosarum TaxID=312026 RepID=UPI000488B442|nr:hypothetical protein [Paraburkholderia mimosarum]
MMDTKMVVQRLTIRAAMGKLKIIAVWRCLAKSGARVVRWSVCADRNDGTDLMTVDIIESDPVCTEEIAIALGRAPLEMTVTAFVLTVISASRSSGKAGGEPARNAADSRRTARPGPKLTVLANDGNAISPRSRD